MILFIGNLNKLTTEQAVRDLFAKFGAINRLKLMTDRITRRSSGYAYIDMTEDGAGKAALLQLNNTAFDGSNITVEAASKKQITDINRQGILQ